jgi:hypothetical protein
MVVCNTAEAVPFKVCSSKSLEVLAVMVRVRAFAIVESASFCNECHAKI